MLRHEITDREVDVTEGCELCGSVPGEHSIYCIYSYLYMSVRDSAMLMPSPGSEGSGETLAAQGAMRPTFLSHNWNLVLVLHSRQTELFPGLDATTVPLELVGGIAHAQQGTDVGR